MESVRVSESSRREQNGGKDRNSLIKAKEELEDERDAIINRKRQGELRLLEIKATVRGKRLDNTDYNRILHEQAELARENKNYEGKLIDMKRRAFAIDRDLGDKEHEKGMQRMRQLDLMEQIVIDLKAIKKALGIE
jgi:hypothetical protein